MTSSLITSLNQLLDYVELDANTLGYDAASQQDFPLRLPVSFLKRIKKSDPTDPILRQILPHKDEQKHASGFGPDPVGESGFSPVPGLLQKYPGRALLITTGACAINCRYCFRRHFPYEEQDPSLTLALDWLAEHDDIHEVILSGGDPFTLSLRRVRKLLEQLADIPHLQRLRIHSRQPIVSPDCLTPELIELLNQPRFKTVLVVHSNHAQELNDEVADAFAPLHKTGVTLLNQSVLLAGVNDSKNSLCDLSERLFEIGILPYYLHQLDKVAGASHFAVSDATALALHRAMRDQLSGYLVPRLVVEQAGAQSKTPLLVAE